MPAPVQPCASASPADFVREAPAPAGRVWLWAGQIALTGLLFARNPDVVLHPQFWHEDALIFLSQQRTEGLAAIFHPYAGYLHLLPRLVASGASLLPLELTPLLYLIGAYAGWLWTGALVLTSPLFASARWAFLAGIVWVMVPNGGEIFVNLTNVQWPLTAGLALLLAEGTGSHRSRSHMWLFASVTALTGAGATVLLPVAGWQLWESRRHPAPFPPVALATLVLGGLQLAIVLFSPRLPGAANASLIRTVVFPWLEMFPELLGTKTTFPADLGLRLVGTTLGLTALAWAWRRTGPAQSMRSRLLLGAVLMLEAGVLAYTAEYGGTPKSFDGGQRYLFVPFVLYTWMLISALACEPRPKRWLVVCVGLVFLCLGHQTGRQFSAPRHPVADWPTVCEALRQDRPAEFAVAPFATKITLSPHNHPGTPKP
jgi:hypothetical protein